MTLSVSPSDLDSLLSMGGTIDADRAQLLLDLAVEQCQIIVSPLPDNARSVVLNVAARAYNNPTGVAAQTIGPESVQYGSTAIGVYLTKTDIETLQRLAGTGGAFTVDPTPADAGTQIYPWDLNVFAIGPEPWQ